MSPDTGIQNPTMRKAWRIMAAMALLLAAATLFLSVVLFGRQADANRENCERIHTLTATLDRMIADSRKSLDAYVADGTITRVQAARELARIQHQRQELGGADCPPRRV